ncbi:unnamed protein product [Oreochromis niloticus]|nr:unnamed protein product [Mustela putorius furo]
MAHLQVLLMLLWSSGLWAEGNHDSAGVQCETAKADLVMLVDESGSISSVDFRVMKSFLIEIVKNFNIGPDKVQIGLTSFARAPMAEWYLNSHLTKDSLTEAIKRLVQLLGPSYTGKALRYILHNQFKPYMGMRPDSRKIVVLITDGAANDDIHLPSKNLKDTGIEVYAIGVGAAPERDMKSIASDTDHMYLIEGFSSLHALVKNVSMSLCNSANSLDSVRLLNGSSLCSGRLQVKSNQRWSSVCEDDFDQQDAEVGCRELGCGPPSLLQGALYGEVEAPVLSREFQCGGHESALLDCRSSGSVRSSCSPGKAAGLTCSEPVRLVGGASRCAGTLEVKQGLWKSVEASGWTLKDAAVACRELDCGSAVLTGSRNASWDGPTWKIKPACVKSGSTLRECATSSQSPTVLELICSDLLVQPIISASSSSNDGDSQVQQQESSWVLKGSSFTISCSIQPQYPGGSFQLTFTSSSTTNNYTQPAVNHSAHFLFPAAEPAHQGTYSCVYRVFVFSRNFSSESRQLSLTVSDPTVFVIRLLLLLLSLLLFISAVCFSHKVTGRQEPRPPEDQELDG